VDHEDDQVMSKVDALLEEILAGELFFTPSSSPFAASSEGTRRPDLQVRMRLPVPERHPYHLPSLQPGRWI